MTCGWRAGRQAGGHSHRPRPPDYFTGDVPGLIERDAADHDTRVLTGSGQVGGFAVPAAGRRGDLWIAVESARRDARLAGY